MKDPFRWSFEVVVGDNVTSVGYCGNQNLRNFCEKDTQRLCDVKSYGKGGFIKFFP